MDTLYKEYRKLGDSGSWLGLEPGHRGGLVLHPGGSGDPRVGQRDPLLRIPGFGEMVFCVNPEPLGEQFVYPVARNFRNFLGLILAAGNTNPLQQVIGWDRDSTTGSSPPGRSRRTGPDRRCSRHWNRSGSWA